MNINGAELLIILVVALVVLGPKELPRIGRALGTMVREFRRASHGIIEELALDEGEEARPKDQGGLDRL